MRHAGYNIKDIPWHTNCIKTGLKFDKDKVTTKTGTRSGYKNYD